LTNLYPIFLGVKIGERNDYSYQLLIKIFGYWNAVNVGSFEFLFTTVV